METRQQLYENNNSSPKSFIPEDSIYFINNGTITVNKTYEELKTIIDNKGANFVYSVDNDTNFCINCRVSENILEFKFINNDSFTKSIIYITTITVDSSNKISISTVDLFTIMYHDLTSIIKAIDKNKTKEEVLTEIRKKFNGFNTFMSLAKTISNNFYFVDCGKDNKDNSSNVQMSVINYIVKITYTAQNCIRVISIDETGYYTDEKIEYRKLFTLDELSTVSDNPKIWIGNDTEYQSITKNSNVVYILLPTNTN